MFSGDLIDFPAIPESAKFAILIPTARWDFKVRAILASLIGVAGGDVVVLISDNSEITEKHEFLMNIKNINNNIFFYAHKKNIGAIDNFYFLHQWCANVEFSAIMADDDFVSPEYYLDAYNSFLKNGRASCISAGAVFVDFGNRQFHKINQPTMEGECPIDRIRYWNGWAPRVTMYDVSRRVTLNPAIDFLINTPLQGLTLMESIFELSRLSQGDFHQLSGKGFFVHYPFHGGGGGEEFDRFYKLLFEGVGLKFPMVYFMKLSTAVQCAVFLQGRFSPIVDENQKKICAQHVFRHLFFDGFIAADLSRDGVRIFIRGLLKDSDSALVGFDYYCNLKDKNSIEFDFGFVKWFLEIVKLFESPAEDGKELLSEKFAKFCADALNVGVSAIDQAVIGRDSSAISSDERALQWSVPNWMNERAPSAARILAIQAMLQTNPDVGTLGVAVVVPDDSDPHVLVDTLDSLAAQHRPVDSIWLIGPQIPPEAVGGMVEAVIGNEPWPALLSRKIEQGSAPDFLWILYAGDQLLPHASLTLGEYRLRNPDPLIWYADETVLQNGVAANPMLKPDLNIDLLRSYPYVGRNLVLSTAMIQAVGGLDARVADLAPIDLVWRLVEQAGPPVVGHIPEVLLHASVGLMDWVRDTSTQVWSPVVTQMHFERMGVDAQVQLGPALGFFRVEYPLSERPLVSIIIPTRDHFVVLRDCVEGLMEHTAYPNYELLIVDNGSVDQEALGFLSGLEGMGTNQVRVLRWPQAFDFAAINNFAVEQARGDVLLFLNNDIQFSPQTRSDWLERLLRLAVRPEVGMAGARLDLPDGQVDQYGLVLGLDNSVGAAFRGMASDAQGYMYRLVVQQNASALSASCLMMRRTVFQELGGFDTQAFPVYHADTDLSLKATQAGYLLALEPETGLQHMGGATRLLKEKFGLEAHPDDDQRDRLYARWLPQLARDLYYHPAFDKSIPGFSLSRDAARIHDPLPGRPLPVVLASHSDWHGCGHYRILHPFQALAGELRTEGGVKYRDFHFTDVARIQPDVIVLQGAWLNEGILTQIRRYREITGAKVVLEFDDYLPNIPTRSAYRKTFKQSWIKQMRRAIEQVDWLVVSTPVLAQEYAGFHGDIRVAQNGLLPAWWGGLEGRRRAGKKMRVGWAGGSSHTGDLAELRAVIRDLQDDVEWVFMGSKPDGISCEFHAGVPIAQYPAKLASLNLDLAVVPLEMNQFNRSKSNLRLLELGACGVPVICTDIEPYQGELPVSRVRNRPQDWVRTIREQLADPVALAQQGDALCDAVLRDWMLEGAFLDQWVRAWGVAPAGEPEPLARQEIVVTSQSELVESGAVIKPQESGALTTNPTAAPLPSAAVREMRVAKSRSPSSDSEDPLSRWLAKRVFSPAQSRLLTEYFSQQGGMPKVALFIQWIEQDAGALARTLRSLESLCDGFSPTQIFVVGGQASNLPSTMPQLQHAPAGDAVQVLDVVNRLAGELACDWLLVVDAGDEFTSAGLHMLAQHILAAPDTRAVYGDEMARDASGQLSAFFRPDFNLDLLRSTPATMARHWVFRRDVFLKAGGFDPDFGDAAEFDLLLRLIDRGGVAGLAHIAEPVLVTSMPVFETKASEEKALLRHVRNQGYEYAAVSAHLPGCYRVQYGHQEKPGVSIIIPTRNQLPMLLRCVDSLLEKTTYQNYEVLIVDNGSDEADACAWLDGIEAMNSPQLRVLRYPYPFNYSAMNNLAASQARGEYLVLLNNDTAILQSDWLDAMLNHAQRPEVGVVGAKLLYPDGRIQHAGVVLGLRGPADHPFIGGDSNQPGYMYRLQVDQDYSAVTAACLMIRASLYCDVGGLDEGAFKVSYNDVDLCLKVRESGHLLVWTPHAVLMHEGSVSQNKVDITAVQTKIQRFRAEQDACYAKWMPTIARDPAYSPLLTLQGHGFSVNTRAELNWQPLRWRPLPVVLAVPADRQASGYYRVVHPGRTLNISGLAAIGISDQSDLLIETERLAPDTVVFQRQVRVDQIDAQQRLAKFSHCFKVADLDDYLPTLPGNSAYREHQPKEILKFMRESLALVDRLIVSTEPLAEALKGLHPDVRVVENRLFVPDWSSLSSLRRQGRKPRVGWASGLDHYNDLDLIVDVLKALADEVEWVFLGACPDAIRRYAYEWHAETSMDDYPAQLASLNLDVALAPLADTRFNQCTSNRRVLEYGACGIPVVCSDVQPYRGNLPVTRVNKPRFKDWVNAIRMHTYDLDASAQAGNVLRDAVLRSWMLDERHAETWRAQWVGN
ncbi:glycosyltransferase [Castellaniella denitrificans]|uniref:Glycosyltransferase n=1 Tax=Castellaniella denitrificans TaxID=56119 RepID=A0ABT4M7W3_9BURK|nr:glycosyltransferase [Castellaniella denitrificans]MCZ4330206.1 glycosyltransferase [Castellaniella denitrificans]